MQAYFYETSKRKNSTRQMYSDPDSIRDIKLKDTTSITDPVILLSGDWQNYNYVYLPAFRRMYFITGSKSISDNIFEITCKVDVLATYRDIIRSMSFFVERASRNYNAYYNDNLVSPTQKITHRSVATTSIGFSTNHGSFVVRIAGGDDDGVSTYVVPSLSDLSAIFNKDRYFSSSADSWTQMVGNYVFDPYDYVVDLFWSPLNVNDYAGYGSSDIIKIKWFSTGISAYKLNNRAIKTINENVNIPSNIYSDFRKYNPNFSRYNINIPSMGIIELDNNHVDNLKIAYVISLDTGATSVYLNNSSSLDNIASYQTNIYTSLQYGSTAQNVFAITGSVINTVGALKSGNIPMGVSAGIQTVSNIITPTPSIFGSNGGTSLVYNTLVSVSLTCYGSGDIDLENWGRPLNRVVQLNSLLGGFVKCAGASADISCYDSEREELNGYLNNGFYLE